MALFVEQAAQHYQEIVENCEVNFVKEIEFERFRENFTYEEAEEIRMEFEKITTWFQRVEERDFFVDLTGQRRSRGSTAAKSSSRSSRRRCSS